MVTEPSPASPLPATHGDFPPRDAQPALARSHGRPTPAVSLTERRGRRIVAVILCGCALIPLLSSSAEPRARYDYQSTQMGMPFDVTLYARSEAVAEQAARAAFRRIESLNAILSDYEFDSELSRLSRTAGSGGSVPVSQTLWDVLTASQRLACLSDGAFDATIGPCTSLWRHARRRGQMPREDYLAKARAATGYDFLILDEQERTALLTQARMRLDLGGIAKGYALDAAARELRKASIETFLIRAGGDMIAGTPPPNQPSGWTLRLPGLHKRSDAEPESTETLQLSNRAFATSGDLFQYVELDGVRYSHIVDPRTGIGLTRRTLVYVVAPDATTADSLATALSVLDPKTGVDQLLPHHPKTSARIYWIDPDGQRQTTESQDFPQTNPVSTKGSPFLRN